MQPLLTTQIAFHRPRTKVSLGDGYDEKASKGFANDMPRLSGLDHPGGEDVPILRNSSSSFNACSNISRLFSTCALDMQSGGAILKTFP